MTSETPIIGLCRVAFAAALLWALVACPMHAQTPTYKLAWDLPQTTVAAAGGYVTTLKVDALAAVTVLPACAASAVATTTTVCTAPLPVLASGSHTLIVTVFADGTSAASDPYVTHPPTKPVNISIVITLTIGTDGKPQ